MRLMQCCYKWVITELEADVENKEIRKEDRHIYSPSVRRENK